MCLHLCEHALYRKMIGSIIEQKTIESSGSCIHYFTSGKNDSEAIILLHSAFSDHRIFNLQITPLASHYRVIAIDLLGHGLSVLGRSNEDIRATTKHISMILKTEGKTYAHLIGVSLGSLLAQDFALKHPEKTLSLTAVGGYSIQVEQCETARAQRIELFRSIFKLIFSMDAFRRHVAEISVINSAQRALFFRSAQLFSRKSFRVISPIYKLIGSHRSERLYAPLLIVVGDEDLPLSHSLSKRWHLEVHGSQLLTISQAGHCANMDNPEQFNTALLSFLKKQKRINQQ